MSKQETETLQLAYDAGASDEYQRLATPDGAVEFTKVCAAIEKYTSPGAVIYDIGCGPGRYTEHLINKGFYVGCADLSKKSLAMFDERLQAANSDKILFSKACCASKLDWIASESADTVLLLGPMYHITDVHKRKTVIAHCHRVLKKGGVLIAMFLSPYGALTPQLIKESNVLEIAGKEKYMVTTTCFKGYMVPQYRCWPKDAAEEFHPSFIETDTIHIDEIQVPVQHNSGKLNKPERCSHQFFVVFKKNF